MEFRESGLRVQNPQDITIPRAFEIFDKNRNYGPEEGSLVPTSHEIAKILQAHGADDKTVGLALLEAMPPLLFSIIEKRFGKEMLGLLQELRSLEQKECVGARNASVPVREVCLATAIGVFEGYKKMAERIPEQVVRGDTDIPVLDLKLYDRLSNELVGYTSNIDLESSFMKGLAECRTLNEENIRMARELDGGDEKDGAEMPLMDHPAVRRVHEAVTADNRVAPGDLMAAQATARILAATSDDPKSSVIALLDISMPWRTAQDIERLVMGKKLDRNVADILAAHSVYKPMDLAHAPPAFRQTAVALNVLRVIDARAQTERLLRDAGQLPSGQFSTAALQLKKLEKDMVEGILPVLGQTGAPDLDRVFEKHLKDFSIYFNAHVRMKPPKPPGFGM